jgi:hypothetical protein
LALLDALLLRMRKGLPPILETSFAFSLQESALSAQTSPMCPRTSFRILLNTGESFLLPAVKAQE